MLTVGGKERRRRERRSKLATADQLSTMIDMLVSALCSPALNPFCGLSFEATYFALGTQAYITSTASSSDYFAT
jgi:hypothetical protein